MLKFGGDVVDSILHHPEKIQQEILIITGDMIFQKIRDWHLTAILIRILIKDSSDDPDEIFSAIVYQVRRKGGGGGSMVKAMKLSDLSLVISQLTGSEDRRIAGSHLFLVLCAWGGSRERDLLITESINGCVRSTRQLIGLMTQSVCTHEKRNLY